MKELKVSFSQRARGFSFKKIKTKAVDGLSLTLFQGKTLALVGESGCGKTSASRALLRLLPVSSGQIFYRGQNVLDLKGKMLTKL